MSYYPKDEELLPCPFCGSPAKFDEGMSWYMFCDVICCQNKECRAMMVVSKEKWNRRVSLTSK